MRQADIGLIGLGVMGQNLALNMADHGFTVAVFNRTVARVDEFVAANPGQASRLVACHSLEKFAEAFEVPARRSSWSRPAPRWTPRSRSWHLCSRPAT